MKTVYFRTLFFALLCIATGHVTAQNKSLGVGTPTPNTNAALHVESPTGNQGFIMPRLTTAQRTAMAGLLTATDEGLMLFDTELNTIFIWDGATWRSTAEVAGGTKLAYPYKDSVIVAPGTTDVFALKYNAAQNARVLRVENLRADNGSSALSVLSNGTGLAGYFQVNNPASGSTAVFGTTNSNIGGALAPVGVYGESTGTGSLGGAFWNTNAANNFPALYTRTQGTGSAATLEIVNPANTAPVLVLNTNGTGNALQTAGRIQAGQFVGDGSLLTNVAASPFTFPFNTPQNTATTTFEISNTNVAGAGAFRINNASSTAFALVGETNGANPSAGVYGLNTGDGFGVLARANGTSFGSAAVYGEQLGAGDAAGAFRIINGGNTYSALFGETNGSGSAIFGRTTGTNRAGQFQINNSTNAEAALRGFTDGLGRAGYFTVNNATNNAEALFTETNGTGVAGSFLINNPSNTSSVLRAETNGTGPAIAGIQMSNTTGSAGYFQVGDVTNNLSTGAAVFGAQNGLGRAGTFQITNSANSEPAIRGYTDGTGRGLWVSVNNATNDSPAIMGQTNGVGPAVYGLNTGPGDTFSPAGHFVVDNPTNTHAAIQGNNSGAGAAGQFLIEAASNGSAAVNANTIGTGRAGNFVINNAGNTSSAVYGETNGTGPAIEANHPNNGLALLLLAGGLRIPTASLAGGGVITTRAIAYRLTAPSAPTNYTFPGGYLQEGDTFFFYNDGPNAAQIEGNSIPVNTGVIMVYIGGQIRFYGN